MALISALGSRRRMETEDSGPSDSGGYTAPTPTQNPTSAFEAPGITAGPPKGPIEGPSAPAAPYRFDQNAFNQAFGQTTQGKSGTLQEFQSSIFPQLQSMFPDIQNFGSKGDKIRLPNGQVVDAVISAGAGGRGYALQYDNGGTGGYFDDPLLQGYLDFGQGAIDKLMQPQAINPVLQQAIDALTRMSSQGAPHLDTSYMQPITDAVKKRQGQIDQPGWSPAQQDILRTQVSDPLEAQRTAARQQVMERLAARGIQPGSGIMEQALLDVDRGFSQMRTTGERDLATKQMGVEEARQQEAVSNAQLLSALGLSGSQADLQGQVAGRGQNLSAAGTLGSIGNSLQDEPLRNLMSAMGIYGNMAQLPFQSNANAIASMNAINGANVPQANDQNGLISLLMQLAQGGENTHQNAQGDNSAFLAALGQSMPGLLEAFGGLFDNGKN